MPEVQTKSDMQKPPGGPPTIAASFSDEIESLGDQIMALSQVEAKQLSEYLKQNGVTSATDN